MKKRILSLFLAFCMVPMTTPVSALANEIEISNQITPPRLINNRQ